MAKWRDKNFGIHPADPDYDDSYDAEEDYERYLDEQESKYQNEKEK